MTAFSSLLSCELRENSSVMMSKISPNTNIPLMVYMIFVQQFQDLSAPCVASAFEALHLVLKVRNTLSLRKKEMISNLENEFSQPMLAKHFGQKKSDIAEKVIPSSIPKTPLPTSSLQQQCPVGSKGLP